MSKKKTFILNLDKDTQTRFKILCARKNKSMSSEIERIMNESCKDFETRYSTKLKVDTDEQ